MGSVVRVRRRVFRTLAEVSSRLVRLSVSVALIVQLVPASLAGAADPPSLNRYEDSDALLSYSGPWIPVYGSGESSGTAKATAQAGSAILALMVFRANLEVQAAY
jgi:hypothetical protein